MKYSTGHIPDHPEHVSEDLAQRHIGGLIGARPGASIGRDWRYLLDDVLNQGGTESCVAHWFSSALFLASQVAAERGAGPALPRISRRWCYNVARWRDQFGTLIDAGCRPRQMMIGAERNGLIAESAFGWSELGINEMPPFDLDIAARDMLFSGYYRADAIADQLRLALDKGHFPGIAMPIHEGFYDYDGKSVYDEPRGKPTGGMHMVTLIGYEPGAFLMLNSWGTGWGDDGFGWLSDRFVERSDVTDRLVVTAVSGK